ncbi:hypothetical protein EAI_02160 [Harpegnathos saltator]|uniref:CCHC-type domain-containing protein n=1 Tax=Harpegnathos saltator TaxID=610380 RepID=E2BLL6_HARSA|nr:hypothetical protein EAI_02160 [Harpegnathos saltator]
MLLIFKSSCSLKGALYLGKRIRFAPSLQKVIRCLNCQRFGHVEAQCRGGDKARSCHNCASNDHLSKECNSNSIACINCIRRNLPKTDHRANSYYCSVFIENKKIKIIMSKLGLGPREAFTYYKSIGINQPENWFSINPSYNDDLPTLLDFAPWLKDFDPNLGKEHNQSPTKDIPESYSSVISRKNTLKKQTSNRRALTARRRKRSVGFDQADLAVTQDPQSMATVATSSSPPPISTCINTYDSNEITDDPNILQLTVRENPTENDAFNSIDQTNSHNNIPADCDLFIGFGTK